MASRPIDASVQVLFDAGGLTGTNSFTVYFREAVTDFITMIELDQYTMGELDGRPVPDQGDAKWEPRDISTLENLAMDTLEPLTMRELERQEDYDLLSSFRVTIEWGAGDTNIYGLNSEDVGQTFLNVGSLTLNEIYVALIDVYDNAWRVRICATDEYHDIAPIPVFDTGVVNDPLHILRRKGEIRIAKNFTDPGVEVLDFRTRSQVFAEYRSMPMKSHTPVEGCQVFAEHSPGIQHFESLSGYSEVYRNLVENPSFVEMPTDTVFSNGVTVTNRGRSTNWFVNSPYSFRFRVTDWSGTPDYAFCYPYGWPGPIAAEVGKTYGARFTVNITELPGEDTGLFAGLIFGDGAVGTGDARVDLHDLGTGVHECVVVGVAPADTAYVSPQIGGDGASGTSDVYTDAWIIVELPTGSTTADVPEYFDGDSAHAAWSGTQHDSQSVRYANATARNLLRNPRMAGPWDLAVADQEKPSVGYTIYDNGGGSGKSWTRVESGGPNGEDAWRVQVETAGSNHGFFAHGDLGSNLIIPIKAGDVFMHTFWWKGNAMPQLASNTAGASVEKLVNPDASPTTWQRHVWRITFPNDGGLTDSGVDGDYFYLYCNVSSFDVQTTLWSVYKGTEDLGDIIYDQQPNIEWDDAVNASQSALYTFGVVERDREKSLSGESYKMVNIGTEPDYGVVTNVIDFKDWDNTRVEFDIWYPQEAIDAGNPPLVYLLYSHGIVPINIGHVTGDSWHHVKFYPVEGDKLLTGDYRILFRQAAEGPVTWWLDNISVIEESMRWEARAVVEDPWGDRKGEWTHLRDLVNTENGGVLFHERGTDLQVRGQALRQDVVLGKVKVKPKYAELGRLVWDEEISDTDLLDDVNWNQPHEASFRSGLNAGSQIEWAQVEVDFGAVPASGYIEFLGSPSDGAGSYVSVLVAPVEDIGWQTFVFDNSPTYQYFRVQTTDGADFSIYDLILRPALNAPTASFSTSINGATVDFTSTSGNPSGLNALLTIFWNFGDGAQGFGKTASHTYAETGVGYNVTITAVSDRGLTTVYTEEVGV